jgi:hypothetical protein
VHGKVEPPKRRDADRDHGGSETVIPARVSPPQSKEGFLMPHTQAPQPDQLQSPTADFRLTYHGTITTITPLTERCREWVEENVEIEPWRRFGNAIAVEPRYVQQLAEAMIEGGLVIEGDGLSEED